MPKLECCSSPSVIPFREDMLHGRGSECAALDGLLDGVRANGSAVVVVRGEPGIGKTALLRYLVYKAAGFRVVRCVSVESEMQLAFAGLHELCDFRGRPLERRSLFAGLPTRFTGDIRCG